MTRVAYIAGPVTGLPDRNREAFKWTAGVVEIVTGARAVTPLELVPKDATEVEAMRVCLDWICDHAGEASIVLVRGWRDSLGTLAEVALARKLRVPVGELIDGEIREV